MFLDTVGETLGNLAVGFGQGWNQSMGYQSQYGYQYDPYRGAYIPIPAAQVPYYQYPAYAQNAGGMDMLPLILIGGLLLFALTKD